MLPTIVRFTLIGLALVTVGCSAGKDEMSKQLDEVRQEVTAIRASNAALRDRLDALESMPTTAAVESATAEDESSDRPNLEVVHLSPEEEPEEEETVVAPIDTRPAVDIVGDKNGVNQVEPPAADPKAKTSTPKKRAQ